MRNTRSLYKEDFEKFSEGFKDAVSFIDNSNMVIKPSTPASEVEPEFISPELTTKEFSNVDFDDLGKK